ncbi:MAG: NADH-quinone oxidoreductase subunit C [Candidatus Omnitrophica bacterium]|nr:NADH-quinone oxidoreductase subunit C [Candidatus Omnitrophota bacterium]
MNLAEAIRQRFPQHVIAARIFRGQQTVVLKREGLLDVARYLRDDAAQYFDMLMDLSCVDYLKFGTAQHSAPTLVTPSPLPYYMTPRPVTETWERGVSNDDYRFDLVYHFYSTAHNHRLRVRVPVAMAHTTVPSLTGVWASADWYEREVWDMFGIRFTGHPNLRRILMYEEFTGHPLRKDYPVRRRQPLIGPMN